MHKRSFSFGREVTGRHLCIRQVASISTEETCDAEGIISTCEDVHACGRHFVLP